MLEDDPNGDPKDEEEEDDEPNPVELCLFELLDELDPKDDPKNDDDDPWLLDP